MLSIGDIGVSSDSVLLLFEIGAYAAASQSSSDPSKAESTRDGCNAGFRGINRRVYAVTPNPVADRPRRNSEGCVERRRSQISVKEKMNDSGHDNEQTTGDADSMQYVSSGSVFRGFSVSADEG
jgi:hypothetical protein